MTLNVSFGNGATADSLFLDQRDATLNQQQKTGGGSVQTTSTSNGVTISNLDGPVPATSVPVGGASGTGGTVAVNYTEAGNSFNFTSSAWNAVKNALAQSNEATNVKFTNFVNVNVDFSAVTSGNSSVAINNVKRAVVDTGAGDDKIAISLSTNDNGFTNKILVNSGAGNDTITLTAGQKVGQAGIVDGRFTDVVIDAGAGNDTINLSGLSLKSAQITGGAGDDTFTGNNNADIYVYNAVAGGNSGNDTITNFVVGTDKLQLNDGLMINGIATLGGGVFVALSDDTTIKLIGVTAGQVLNQGVLLA